MARTVHDLENLGLSLPVTGMGIALRRASVKTALLGPAIAVAHEIVAAAPALVRPHSVVPPTAASRH